MTGAGADRPATTAMIGKSATLPSARPKRTFSPTCQPYWSAVDRVTTRSPSPQAVRSPPTTVSRPLAATNAAGATPTAASTVPPRYTSVHSRDAGAGPSTATAASDNPGVPAGASTDPARTPAARPAVLLAAVVCTVPVTRTANATVSSTGAAVPAVRRTAVSALCRASMMTGPRLRQKGQLRNRITGGTTAGANADAATTSAMVASSEDVAVSSASVESAAPTAAAPPMTANAPPPHHRSRPITRSSTVDSRRAA